MQYAADTIPILLRKTKIRAHYFKIDYCMHFKTSRMHFIKNQITLLERPRFDYQSKHFFVIVVAAAVYFR